MDWNDSGRGMMNGSGYAIFGTIAMVLFFAVLVWVLVRMVGHSSQSNSQPSSPVKNSVSGEALDHLNMRLAKGEIAVEEYNVLKQHLLS